MELRICHQLDSVPARDWNGLSGTEQPFLRHEFLAALERHGAVAPNKGWLPHHLLLFDDRGLAAAAPAYLKSHSWGEFVFDWAWADAYERIGLRYYPKLIAAVPFSPVTGPRVLSRPDVDVETAVRELGMGAQRLCADRGYSSMHWLFPPEAQCRRLVEAGYELRLGCQFHWQDRGFGDMDGFLAALSAKKRKNIRREREAVRSAGVRFRWLHGGEIAPEHWRWFVRFYRNTFREYGNIPPMNLDFFQEIGATLGRQVLLVLAERGDEPLAAALFLRSDNTLYGRYWGCGTSLPGLHFETCYYQGIEYCLRHGLRRFEPGAQGEHKIARGFLPTPTYSAHWLAEPHLREAIAEFLRREAQAARQYMSELTRHSPYRQAKT